MKDGTQEYIAVINPPTNHVNANAPPLYYEVIPLGPIRSVVLIVDAFGSSKRN